MRIGLVAFLFFAFVANATAATGERWQETPSPSAVSKVDSRFPGVPLPRPMPTIEWGVECGRTLFPWRSCTWPAGPIRIAPDDIGDRETLYHELGHQVDYTLMTDYNRDTFRRLIHDPRPWRPLPGDIQSLSPHEQFAEAYVGCALGALTYMADDGSTHAEGGNGYDVPLRTYHRICQMISRL